MSARPPVPAADSAAENGQTAADRLFLEAVEREDPVEQAALLDARCAGDRALRAEVEELLAAHAAAGGVLDRTLADGPTAGRGETDGASEAAELPPFPDTQGNYHVLEPVGRGGMGVVWRARDRRLDRIVAVKALTPALAADPVARRRFVREARAAAAVTHPHVVTIHAVEPDGPTPFLVMEYVAGRSLKEKLDADGPLELRETLRIGAQTAAGLAAAHERGLIHRDVKPGNVLLENGVERVKLTDFGLARAADDAALTQTGQIAGTPQFMSPEQAEGRAVDHRSDLFSLGAVLYAMCAGRPPFRGESTVAVLRRVCDELPRPLREANPEVPPWLAALIERLLSKNPDDRFQSAAEVAALLNRRLLELENPGLTVLPAAADPSPAPVRRPAGGRRLRRWTLAGAVLLASLLSIGAAEATGVTEIVPTVVRLVRGEGVLAIAVSDPNVRVTVEGEDLLITGAGAGEIRVKPGAYTVKADRDGEPVFQEVITVERNGREAVNVRWEPKGAVAETVERADAPAAASLPRRFHAGDAPLNSYKVTWDATAEAWKIDGLAGRNVRLYELSLNEGPNAADKARTLLYQAQARTENVTGKAYLEMWVRTPDGGRFFSRGFDSAVRETTDWTTIATPFDLEAGQRAEGVELNLVIEGGGTVWLRNIVLKHGEPRDLPARPDAPHSPEEFRALWDRLTGRGTPAEPAPVEPADRDPQFVAPRFGVRAPVGGAGAVSLVRRFEGHTAAPKAVAVSPDGELVAGGSGFPKGDRTARVWEVDTGRERHVFRHPAAVMDVAFSPDGAQLLTGGADGIARVFDLDSGEELRQYKGTDVLMDVAYSPDGATVLAASHFGEAVYVWNAETGAVAHVLKHERRRPLRVVVTPDGDRVVAADDSGQLLIWSLDGGTFLKALPATAPDRKGSVGLALSPDGREAMIADNAGLVRLWDLDSGEQRWSMMSGITAVQGIAVSPDGATALAVGGAGSVRNRALAVLDWETGEKRLERGYEGGLVWDAAFLPDGERFVTVSGSRWMKGDALPTGDFAVSLWELPEVFPNRDSNRAAGTDRGPRRADDGPQFVQPQYPTFGPEGPRQHEAALSLVRRFGGHDAAPGTVAVSPDGALVASGSGRPIGDRTARVWEVETGKLLHTFEHDASVYAVAFSPKGYRLLTGAADGVARVWNLSGPGDVGRVVREFWAPGALLDVAYGPDDTVEGGIVVGAAADGKVYVWKASTGDVVHVLEHKGEQPTRVAVTPDGGRVVAIDRSGQLLIWNLDDGAFVKAIPVGLPDREGDGDGGLALLADGRRALVGDDAGIVRLWDLETGEEVWSTMCGVIAIQAIALSPDGNLALVGGGSGTPQNRALSVLDVNTGVKQLDRGYEGGFLWDVAFLPDGERFVTAAGSRWFRNNPIATGDDALALWTLRRGEAPPADARASFPETGTFDDMAPPAPGATPEGFTEPSPEDLDEANPT
ncbi:WD40 repeat domain-containing serine/threonine protein kinase [Alienimonas sp. DA493]|uniref:WD40 repeat domain-containing serine/threonine protein kinase n=1 Tax=Alienimonas sp. DA493 TaxID=3373605 RepID=UPI003754EC84